VAGTTARMRYEAILFDFDGIVVDSEPVHHACWREVLTPLGIDLTWEHYHQHFIGVSDRRMSEDLAAMAPRPMHPDEVSRYYPAKTVRFREEMQRLLPFSPGMPELMRSLTDYRLAVVTSSRRGEVEPVLQAGNLLGLLDATVYAEDVTKHKPDPEPYLRAAELLGISHALVVEDSAAGEAAGRAAGFEVLRVTTPADVAATLARHLHYGSMKA